jgi:hypothetical protein
VLRADSQAHRLALKGPRMPTPYPANHLCGPACQQISGERWATPAELRRMKRLGLRRRCYPAPCGTSSEVLGYLVFHPRSRL